MEEINELLKDIHNLRMLMIGVGTGERRIQDTEQEYVQLRTEISQNRAAGAAACATIALLQEEGWTQPGKAASKGQPAARSSG